MTILDDLRCDIERRINDLSPGEEFSLRTLFGGRKNFQEFASSGERKSLGVQFRKAVEEGAFGMVEYSRHSDSPAEHLYRRIF